jgi:hypothetical protein
VLTWVQWIWLALALVTSTEATAPVRMGRVRPTEGPTASPVVVELFTSEGCSSCPSADEVLTRLVFEQPVAGVHVIGLSEHVDYWDRLGWRDPFSSPQFTGRQGDYAVRAFRGNGAYTPQVVVDGLVELVGSDYRGAVAAIATAARQPKARVHLSAVTGATIDVTIKTVLAADPSDLGPADILVGITEDGLSSDVRRGENRGRHLQHSAVVRAMTIAGSVWPGGEFARTVSLPRDTAWSGDLRIFTLVQSRASRRILGAADVAGSRATNSE